MNHFVIASGVLALGLYIPLCRQIWRGTVEQNLATWILWVALDLIALGTVLAQDGNFAILAAYVCGGTVTICCILKSRKFGWTWIESMTAALVLVCVITWALVGAWQATIMSSLAVVTAAIPQVVDSYRKPRETPLLVYIGYIVANILALLGGKDWSIEERFYPICAGLVCCAVALAASRRWLKS